MKRIITSIVSGVLTLSPLTAQTTTNPQKSLQEVAPQDVVRVTTQLVQTDVVVTDKSDQIVPDLKLQDFELFENGKKQDLQFLEFVSSDSNAPPRTEGLTGSAKINPAGEDPGSRSLTRESVKRAIAFVVDDVTIPHEDLTRVREMLSNFVDHQMLDGDLVAIIRTVGSNGLLDQFTSDKEILRRAIGQLGARSVPPYVAFTGPDGRPIKLPGPNGMHDTREEIGDMTIDSGSAQIMQGADEGSNQVPRAFLALSISNLLVDSLRRIPGRKNLVLLSGGLPMFDLSTDARFGGDIGQLFQQLTDNATRSGVVINTMDVRGLTTAGAVAKFVDTPAKSALGGGALGSMDESASFGRAADTTLLGAKPLSLTQQLTLSALAGQTGGLSVTNTNNFGAGLDKILNRSRAYYRLAYRPSEPFDNKFHKVEIKVRRSGVHTYTAEGYYAREDKARGPVTKEAEIIKAATSPLAKRDLDVAAELQYKFLPTNQAQLDINAFIDARKLQFTKSDDGKHHASFDIAGFVFDQVGKNRGGISQTVNADLSEEEYQRALSNGISYTASTQAPPGYYQVRLVVREVSTGKIGSVSRYFEVPDLSNKQLMMSSIVLYGMNPTGADKNPQQLSPTRVVSRKQDLRYAVVVYNAKLEGNKPAAKSQLMISQNGKLLFKEPEQPIQTPGSAAGQFIKVGQLGLSKVNPGRYVLTLVVTDPLADKKRQIISRSVDFTVVD